MARLHPSCIRALGLALLAAPGRGSDGSLPGWQPWAAKSPRFLALDTEADGGVRMAEGALSLDAVVAGVKVDPRLDGPDQRCEVLFEMARWTRTRDAEPPETRYAELAGDLCVGSPAAVAAGR